MCETTSFIIPSEYARTSRAGDIFRLQLWHACSNVLQIPPHHGPELSLALTTTLFSPNPTSLHAIHDSSCPYCSSTSVARAWMPSCLHVGDRRHWLKNTQETSWHLSQTQKTYYMTHACAQCMHLFTRHGRPDTWQPSQRSPPHTNTDTVSQH